MQILFNVCKNCTFTFKIGLPSYPSGLDAGFPIHGPGFKSRLFQPFIPLKLTN